MSSDRRRACGRHPARCSLVMVTLVGALATTGCRVTEPELEVAVQTQDWPQEVLVGDTTELRVTLTDLSSGRGLLADVAWAIVGGSDAELIGEDGGSDPSGTMVRLVAGSTGPVELVARLDAPGLTADSARGTIEVHMKWVDLSAGFDHACGVTSALRAYCWGGAGGSEFAGLLGDGAAGGSLTPSRVAGFVPFQSVSAGHGHSCASAAGFQVWCWGFNAYGAVGNASTSDQLAPVPLAMAPSWRVVSAGDRFTCGVSLVETAVCVGLHDEGQLGAAGITETCDGRRCSTALQPVEIGGAIVTDFLDVDAGVDVTCGVLESGAAHCWGSNAYGMLGNPAVEGSDTAVAVVGVPEMKAVSVGRRHACGLASDGRAFCWGTNRFGELGIGDAELPEMCGGFPCAPEPMEVASGGALFVDLDVGGRSACALTSEGDAYCWGQGSSLQLGFEADDLCSGDPCARIPDVIPGLRFQKITVGNDFACGLTVAGGGFCWGRGGNGQLGSGGVSNELPRRVADPGG